LPYAPSRLLGLYLEQEMRRRESSDLDVGMDALDRLQRGTRYESIFRSL
jgi:hypothetical protein